MFGKNSLFTDPLIELSYCCYHFSMLFFSFLVFYFTFWDSVVAYVTVSGGLLSESVSKFVSIVSWMRLYPGVFNVPVFFF
jgi:hypothetical protein